MTPEMRRTLTNFQEFFAAKGIAPTIRELMAMEGLASPSSVLKRVHTLVERGYIVKLPGRNRALAPADGIDLAGATIDQLRAELARREADNG